MTVRRSLLVWLVATLAVGHAASAPAGEAPPTPPARETIELHWPDGSLRERRQVLHLADGSTVDDGTFERWYPDGTREYEATFVLGRKDGVTVRYHDNGRVASRQQYRDGKRQGPSVSWDREGRKVKEEHWSDGRPDGIWTIWDDGRVEWTHRFVDGDPDP